MDEKLRMVSRVRGVKESLQEQSETQLANAMAELRQLEFAVSEIHAEKLRIGGEIQQISVAELQNQMLYSDVLALRLEQARQAAAVAAQQVADRRREVQQAYIETNRWSTLEDLQRNRVKDEFEQRQQKQSDDLAVMHHFQKEETL